MPRRTQVTVTQPLRTLPPRVHTASAAMGQTDRRPEALALKSQVRDIQDSPRVQAQREQVMSQFGSAVRPLPQAVRDPRVAHRDLQVPTWDPNAELLVDGKSAKGGWVEAAPARGAAGTHSNLGTADAPVWVDKRMVTGASTDPAQRNRRLESPEVTADDLQAVTLDQAARVNPMSMVPRNILKHALHESWHHAKDLLLAAEPVENKDARQTLMAKLWEFRQWHHDEILRRTQADPEIGTQGLTEWKSAGSTTLTSDIDVNLKGSKTEQAVAVFNRKFAESGWEHEAGVVYDVNVYAMDFMHADSFKGLAERDGTVSRHDFKADGTPTRVSAKEGPREGRSGGGMGTDNPMLGSRMRATDAHLQRVWSLVKMRLYMTAAQWGEHVRGAGIDDATQAAVAQRYDAYNRELGDRMGASREQIDAAQTVGRTGFQALDAMAQAQVGPGQDSENIKMAASNRLYEQKLVEMAELRSTVQAQVQRRANWLTTGQADDAMALDAAIDGNLAILRDLISECAMLSNEAYVTDGAINHTVVGLQSKVAISQTQSESMDAFNENVGDSLKEITRHDATVGEAAYKAGKYLWRMADAARNMGLASRDIDALYEAGYSIANEIKGGDSSQAELEGRAAAKLLEHLGAEVTASPATLMAWLRGVAIRVTIAQRQAAARPGHDAVRARPVTASRPARGR